MTQKLPSLYVDKVSMLSLLLEPLVTAYSGSEGKSDVTIPFNSDRKLQAQKSTMYRPHLLLPHL